MDNLSWIPSAIPNEDIEEAMLDLLQHVDDGDVTSIACIYMLDNENELTYSIDSRYDVEKVLSGFIILQNKIINEYDFEEVDI